MKKKDMQRVRDLIQSAESNVHNDRNPEQKTDTVRLLREAVEILNSKLFTMKP